MTKADLVVVDGKGVGRLEGLRRARAQRVPGGACSTPCGKGRKVTIGGFGTFLVTKRAERGGRNPRTGKAHQDPRLSRAALQAEPLAQGRGAVSHPRGLLRLDSPPRACVESLERWEIV